MVANRSITASMLGVSDRWICNINKLRGRPPQYAPAPVTLIFDFLTLKVVSE